MEELKFIKIFDEETATALLGRGFSYIKEQINANQTVYVFELNEKIESAIAEIGLINYSEIEFVYDDIVHF